MFALSLTVPTGLSRSNVSSLWEAVNFQPISPVSRYILVRAILIICSKTIVDNLVRSQHSVYKKSLQGESLLIS